MSDDPVGAICGTVFIGLILLVLFGGGIKAALAFLFSTAVLSLCVIVVGLGFALLLLAEFFK